MSAAARARAARGDEGLTEAGLGRALAAERRTGTAGGPRCGRPRRRARRAARRQHVDRLAGPLPALRAAAARRWPAGARTLGHRLLAGGRLLAAGNGGSAAEAQHLTAELVGRFDGDRRPLSAIALHADTSSLSAIGNDYGFAQVYARQVRAHARPGRRPGAVLHQRAQREPRRGGGRRGGAGRDELGAHRPRPQPAGPACTDAVCLPGDTATVQEMHLAALHMLCRAVEAALASTQSKTIETGGRAPRSPRPEPEDPR